MPYPDHDYDTRQVFQPEVYERTTDGALFETVTLPEPGSSFFRFMPHGWPTKVALPRIHGESGWHEPTCYEIRDELYEPGHVLVLDVMTRQLCTDIDGKEVTASFRKLNNRIPASWLTEIQIANGRGSIRWHSAELDQYTILTLANIFGRIASVNTNEADDTITAVALFDYQNGPKSKYGTIELCTGDVILCSPQSQPQAGSRWRILPKAVWAKFVY